MEQNNFVYVQYYMKGTKNIPKECCSGSAAFLAAYTLFTQVIRNNTKQMCKLAQFEISRKKCKLFSNFITPVASKNTQF
jgi:hypothetical protein